MFRLALLFIMLLQPLQWAWANMHMTADAMHSVSHASSQKVNSVLETAPGCCVPDKTSCSHACHENHAHYTTVLGLGNDTEALLQPGLPTFLVPRESAAFGSAILPPIERPKWFATR